MKYLSLYENFKKITFELSPQDFEEILKLCCQGFEYTDIPIYRSINSELSTPYNLIDPRKYERTSANTSNFYTLIIDNEKDWRDFPKRKHGIICSLNGSYMGNEFRVIPLLKWNEILTQFNIKDFKYPKWGICNTHDIWHSFHLLKDDSAESFNLLIFELCKFYKIDISDINFDIFKDILSNIDLDMVENTKLTNKYLNEDIRLFVNIMKEQKFNNFYELVKFIYSPTNFKIYTYEEIQKNCTYEQFNECWTDTPVLYEYM